MDIKAKKQEANAEEQNTDATEQKTDSKDAQIAELTDTLKRLQAEFENYKKRIEKENAAHTRNAHVSLVKELLPVLDSFELALKNDNCENPEISKYRKGLELIYSQLHSILEDYGLRPIDTKNQKFDPYKHEVLMVKESPEPEDTILQEFQKGYFLNENIIRHSKVMISKKTENQ
jgi:molecular chaperone GrpE